MNAAKKTKWVGLFYAVLLAAVLPQYATASAGRIEHVDSWESADETKTWAPPAASDTIVGRASTDTLTNKTIDGTANTLSKLPISAQMVQEVPSGSCNGSNTAFATSITPGGAASVLLYLDGLIETQGVGKDYTISGANITLAVACSSGQTLYVVYSKY